MVAASGSQGLVVLLGRPAGPSTTTSTSLYPRPRPFGLPASSRPEIFGGSHTYDLGAPTPSVAAGDFNGDGHTDLAAVTESYNPSEAGLKLSFLYQDGDGSLRRAVRFDTDAVLSSGGTATSMAVAAGDVDGDRLDDVVVRMWGASTSSSSATAASPIASTARWSSATERTSSTSTVTAEVTS